MRSESQVLGSHLVGKVEEVSRREVSEGLLFLFAISVMCERQFEIEWFYTFEELAELDLERDEHFPFHKGEWVDEKVGKNNSTYLTKAGGEGGK